MQRRWQAIPLYATWDTDKLASSDGLNTRELQGALELAQGRADAAERQIVDLREQVATLNAKQRDVMAFGERHASLQEKQEEVIVLREQLSDAEANTRQIAEHLRAVIEEKKRTDKTLLRAASSHEELARLKTEVVEAQKVVESERQKVISTLEELETVKGQLAALTSIERGNAEDISEPHQDQVAAATHDNRQHGLPAAIVFRAYLLPEAVGFSPDEPRLNEERTERPKRNEETATPRLKHATLGVEATALTRPIDYKVTAPARSSGNRTATESAASVKRKTAARSQRVRLVEQASTKANQEPRPVTQNAHQTRSHGALNLPIALLPDNRLW